MIEQSAVTESHAEISLNATTGVREALELLSRFDGQREFVFVNRSTLGNLPFAIEASSLRIAEDIHARELGALLQELTRQPPLSHLRPVMARRFATEGALLGETVHAQDRTANDSSIDRILDFLSTTSQDLIHVAQCLDPRLTEETQPTTAEFTDREQSRVLGRLGINQTTVDDRAQRLRAILDTKSNGNHVVARYEHMIRQTISRLFPEVIRGAMAAEIALMSTIPSYISLPSRIAPPEGYRARNRYGYAYESVERKSADKDYRRLLDMDESFLNLLGVIDDLGDINLRLDTDYSSLRDKFATQIEEIKEKRDGETLTIEEEDAFIKGVSQEIVRYGGWNYLPNIEDKLNKQFGIATEVSPARAEQTGQMHCAIRSALLGQLLLDSGMQETEVMSVCIGVHAGLVIKRLNDRFMFVDYTVVDDSPYLNSSTLLDSTPTFEQEVSSLSHLDVVPLAIKEFGPLMFHGGKEQVDEVTIHRGLKGIACVAYTMLARELNFKGRDEENVELMKIVTTLDPYNPIFRRNMAGSLRSLMRKQQQA